MRVVHHKLVRDQIPAIITAAGGQPVTRVLDDVGYEAALRAKLLEEAHEAQAAPDGELASELADVLEVLQALAAVHDLGWEDIVSEASRKRAERGGFDDRIFLEHVDQAR
jgi:predicted house-cleaning noncanonical NTP pyrophosphatase (MazG superfamily)